MMTIDERLANLDRVIEDGRLIQGDWHDGEKCCLIGALGDDINSEYSCPTELLPSWAVGAIVQMFDGLAVADVVPLARRFSATMRAARGKVIVWEAVRSRWLIDVVMFARDAARPTGDAPDYWPAVEAACNQVIAALRGNGDLVQAAGAAAQAAWAAKAAAWAAWAAEAAAQAAWAAKAAEAEKAAAAAKAAKLASRAEAAKAAASAAQAAMRASANRTLFIALMDAIDGGAGLEMR